MKRIRMRKTNESNYRWVPLKKEGSGDKDFGLVNSERDGNTVYTVKLWWGSGYQLDCYNAYANSAEEALNYVVAYIEKTEPEYLETVDQLAEETKNELIADGEAGDEYEAEEHPSFQESFMYVDATMEGAKTPHYIWSQNLDITPAKGAYRESSIRRGWRKLRMRRI